MKRRIFGLSFFTVFLDCQCRSTNLLRLFSGNLPAMLFNSRTAIAGAIIGLLLVFYNSKNLNCIGVLSFLRLEEEYWRSPFFIQFYWSEF